MGYSSESRTFIGVELPNIGSDKYFDVKQADGESFEAYCVAESYGRDSIQYRFAVAEPATFTLPDGSVLPFELATDEEDCDYRSGNPTDGFGGYAGFDLSFLPLAQRAAIAAQLPALAGAIVERLAKLGLAVDTDAVILREYLVHGV